MREGSAHYPVRGDRIFFMLLTLFPVFGQAVLARQIEVSFSRTSIEAKPGSLIAAGVRVANISTIKQTIDVHVSLPKAWRLVTVENTFELAPQERDIRLITVSVPPEAPAGRYEVRYVAKDRVLPPDTAQSVLEIIVPRVLQLELRLVSEPRFVVAGRQYVSTFVLTNRGNALTKIRLSAKSGNDFSATLDSSSVVLSPREAKTIDVKIATDPMVSTKVQNTLELFAMFDRDSAYMVKSSSVVEVVPLGVRSEDRFLEFPVSLRLSGVGQDDRKAGQIEIAGYGTLSQDRSDRLEFLARAPETQTQSVLGQRDEYRIAYRRTGLELYGGDWNYALTPLTEMGRYGMGAGGKATIDKLGIGGFYNQTRFYEPRQKQTGAYVSYRLLEELQAGVNYLAKSEQTEAKITTFRTIFDPFVGSNMDFEYGVGSRNNENSKAYAFRFEGNQRWISYDVRYVQADANFPGYYRDLNLQSVGMNFQPVTNLRLETYYRDEERNLARDTNLVYAPRDQYYQIGVGYSNVVSLYFRTNKQEDLLPISKYRRQEYVVQARLGYSFANFSLFANADFGRTDDKLSQTPTSYPSNRYALNTSFVPLAGHNYNASVEYSKDQNIYTAEVQERISASLGAFVFLGQATQFQANIYTSRINASFEQKYDLIEMTLEHVFPFQHKLTLRARQSFISPSTDERQTAYHIEYAIPLAIPLARLSVLGQLSGKVTDEQGRGIENVLLNAGGSAAVSDRDGNFLFSALKPDITYLQVDRASIGLDKVTVQPMPMQLVVRGGEETKMEISVIRSSRIEGTVTLMGTSEQAAGDSVPQYVELHNQPGVFLELSNNDETLRRVSDNRGRFLFTDLRPGHWTLKIVGGDIPLYHALEQESFQFDLRSGTLQTAFFKILPRKRQIRILQEGGVIQEDRAEKKPQQPVAPEPKTKMLPEEQCLVVFNRTMKSYVIQLSSWQSEAKARLLAKHAEVSFPSLRSYVETADIRSLGRRYRVQVGPFKTRKEAEEKCEFHRQTHQ